MIYVDEQRHFVPKDRRSRIAGKRHGQYWCHMFADSPEELHAFASRLGLRHAWGQIGRYTHLEHYDLVPTKRRWAIKLGAKEIILRDWMKERGFEDNRDEKQVCPVCEKAIRKLEDVVDHFECFNSVKELACATQL